PMAWAVTKTAEASRIQSRRVPMDEDSVVAHRMRSLARLTRPVIHEARGASSAIGIHAELLATTIEDTPDADLQLRQRRYLDVLPHEHPRLQRVLESFVGYATVPG